MKEADSQEERRKQADADPKKKIQITAEMEKKRQKRWKQACPLLDINPLHREERLKEDFKKVKWAHQRLKLSWEHRG